MKGRLKSSGNGDEPARSLRDAPKWLPGGVG